VTGWIVGLCMARRRPGHRGVKTMQVNHQVLLPLVEDDPICGRLCTSSMQRPCDELQVAL